MDLSLIDWSRAQFALTAMFHWLFVPLTLGLGLIMAIYETIYVRTGDEKWKKLTKFSPKKLAYFVKSDLFQQESAFVFPSRNLCLSTRQTDKPH